MQTALVRLGRCAARAVAARPVAAAPTTGTTTSLLGTMSRAATTTAGERQSARITDAFLQAIPKTDLHVHLDGSLRISTLLDLAKEHGVVVPATTEAELRRTVFKDSYQSLEEYLDPFQYATGVMQTAPALERVAYEFAVDNYSEGVRFFEVRFAPQLHASDELSIHAVVQAVNRGLLRAKEEFNARADADTPPHEYGIIVSGMRFFTKEMSAYFRSFCAHHAYEKPQRLYGLASVALVTAAIDLRDVSKIPIVALDIAGAENGFPASQHKEAYDLAHRAFLNKTVHAGESYGPESIFLAVTALHAERIGHGFHLFDAAAIADSKIEDPERFVGDLAQYVARNRVTLEVCLTSNLQTIPDLKNDAANHHLRQMLANKLSVAICTDNRTVSNTTVCKELRLAVDTFDLSPAQLKSIILESFKRSFFPHNYTSKVAYVESVQAYYKEQERLFDVYGTRKEASI